MSSDECERLKNCKDSRKTHAGSLLPALGDTAAFLSRRDFLKKMHIYASDISLSFIQLEANLKKTLTQQISVSDTHTHTHTEQSLHLKLQTKKKCPPPKKRAGPQTKTKSNKNCNLR